MATKVLNNVYFEVTADNESWIPLHVQCNELFILHFNTKNVLQFI
jgi:hypothetical protein